MPFCFSPWTNIDISPQGAISPCCKFQLKHYTEKYNVQSHDIGDYLNSEFLAGVREQMSQGQWPAGCERCQIEESNGILSKRNLDQQRWQHHYDRHSDKLITASVAFGNTCNLKCITCNSMSSSKWHQEYKDVYGKDFVPVHFYKQTFVQDFVSQVPDLVHLDIPGGEPMLSGTDEQKQLLQHYIDAGRASDITLHYTTNATVFPDQSWLDLWSHFQEVDIQLSIDGVGARYEYIRYPAKWDALTHNVQQYVELERTARNIRLSVSHTVSAYNILYIPEFIAWANSAGLPTPWLGRAHNPAHMRPEVWPAEARQYIQSVLLSSDNISQSWAQVLNQDNSNQFADFVKYTKIHDANRNVDFATTFPELARFL